MLIVDLMNYKTTLSDTLAVTDDVLPLPASKKQVLLDKLAKGGDYTYLTVCDGIEREIVKVTNHLGVLGYERGQDGTTAVAFAKGSKVAFNFNSPTLIRTYICETPCCDDPCQKPAKVVGQTAYTVIVNQLFSTTFVFDGTTPLSPAIQNIPSWLQIIAQNTHFMTLSGTPLVPGTHTLSVAVANSKPSVDLKTITILVTA
jgi:hypothetical protein